MKNLSNVSPFLMLLLPVFFVMALSMNVGNKSNEEVVLKTKNTTTGLLIKTAGQFVK
ncbi:MAG: hypothetical protein K2Q03_07605 [Sphingobacteriaceae bacterium]|nr:hypothetical protein [Sphingobacteriaceae bacterium]